MRLLGISKQQMKEKFKEKVRDLTDKEAERAVEIVLEFLRSESASQPQSTKR